MPPTWVGIRPDANSGALLQYTPPGGVLAGVRFVPVICSHVFCAIYGEPKAVLTDVMTGPPAAGWVMAPEPVKENVWSPFKTRLAARIPVAPRNTPVPPVIVQGKLKEELKLNRKENDALKLSFALKTNVSVPCITPGLLWLLMRLNVTFTFPKGATLPVASGGNVPVAISGTDAGPLKFCKVIGVVVWPRLMLPDPESVKVPALE